MDHSHLPALALIQREKVQEVHTHDVQSVLSLLCVLVVHHAEGDPETDNVRHRPRDKGEIETDRKTDRRLEPGDRQLGNIQHKTVCALIRSNDVDQWRNVGCHTCPSTKSG